MAKLWYERDTIVPSHLMNHTGEVMMNHSIDKIKRYNKWFGYRGFFLAMREILLSKPFVAKVSAPGVSLPLHLRGRTSDVPTFKQVFINLDYYFEIPKSPKVILDCGANVGFASIYFANRYTQSKIIAIEPELSNYELMEKNVDPYPNIIPLRAALWKENTEIDILDPGEGPWSFRATDGGGSDADSLIGKVAGLTVDRIMAEHEIDYIDILKIDIEGAEKEVFENVSAWIHKVGMIIVELHDRFKPGCSQSFYDATIDFDFEHRSGENVILSRTEYELKN